MRGIFQLGAPIPAPGWLGSSPPPSELKLRAGMGGASAMKTGRANTFSFPAGGWCFFGFRLIYLYAHNPHPKKHSAAKGSDGKTFLRRNPNPQSPPARKRESRLCAPPRGTVCGEGGRMGYLLVFCDGEQVVCGDMLRGTAV